MKVPKVLTANQAKDHEDFDGSLQARYLLKEHGPDYPLIVSVSTAISPMQSKSQSKPRKNAERAMVKYIQIDGSNMSESSLLG